jgi:hypothetical protein
MMLATVPWPAAAELTHVIRLTKNAIRLTGMTSPWRIADVLLHMVASSDTTTYTLPGGFSWTLPAAVRFVGADGGVSE